MKHYQHIIAWTAIIFLGGFLSPSCYAHYAATSIKFTSGSFNEVLKIAAEQNKYIFVHTTSNKCRPCSIFANDYYTDAEVSNFFNANFLNYTLNIDNAEYGNFARMNNLGAETELFFYNSNGSLIEITSGSEVQSKKDLLKKGYEVLKGRSQENMSEYQQLKIKYENNREACSVTDLYKYAYLSRTFGAPYNSLVNEYLNEQQLHNMSPDTEMALRVFVYDFSDNVSSKAIDYFLIDLPYYKAIMKGEQVNNRIKLAVQNTLTTAIKNRNKDLFEHILSVISKANLSNDEDYKFNVKAEYFEKTNDWPNLYKVTKDQIAFKSDDPRLLNDAAERFFKYVPEKDEKNLRLALSWAKKSVEIESECYNNLTLAKIYMRLKDNNEAKETFEKCIEISEIRIKEDPNNEGIINAYKNEALNMLDEIKTQMTNNNPK